MEQRGSEANPSGICGIGTILSPKTSIPGWGDRTLATSLNWQSQGTASRPVSTRHLGWRLGEVVVRESGIRYAAAAQGLRRFWKRVPNSPEMQAFVAALLDPIVKWMDLTPLPPRRVRRPPGDGRVGLLGSARGPRSRGLGMDR